MDKRIYLLVSIAFVVGMVELLIGGLLDLVAQDLGVTTGQAGLLITVFALVFSFSGPVLLFAIGSADRKDVTLAALGIFIIGNLIAVLGTSYSAIMLSRIISAASGALLTVMSLALASQIASPKYRGRAIGLVVMGISGSLVLGLPIGVTMGHAYGWRSPFMLVAGLAVLLTVCVALFFARIPTPPPAPLKRQLVALRNRRALFGHLTTFLFLAGHYVLYGYLTPFVIFTMGFDSGQVTLMYFVYGVAAVTGGGIAGLSADRFGPRLTLVAGISLLFVCLLTIPHVSSASHLFWVVLIVWGVLSWSITPPIQTHLVRLSPETADIQQGLNTSVLHLGIAVGAMIGSVVIDQWSVDYNAVVAAGLVATSLATALASFQRKRINA